MPAIVDAVLKAIVGIGDEAGDLVPAPTELDQVNDFLEGVHDYASSVDGLAPGELELADPVSGSDVAEVSGFGRELEDFSGDHDDESKDDSIDLH